MSQDFNKQLSLHIEELRFFIPLKKSFSYFDDKETWQECYISEHRYRLSDNYKLTLVPIDQRYCSQDFYIEDFESALNNGYIVQKTDIKQHIENIKWFDKIGNVQIVHTANIIVE